MHTEGCQGSRMRTRAHVAVSYIGDATMRHMGHAGPFRVPRATRLFLPEGLSAHAWSWDLEVPEMLVWLKL